MGFYIAASGAAVIGWRRDLPFFIGVITGMGVQVIQIGAGICVGVPLCRRTELCSAVADDDRYPAAFLIMVDPAMAQGWYGFLCAAYRTGFLAVLSAGRRCFCPGMLPGSCHRPRFFCPAAVTGSGFFAGSTAGWRRGLPPGAPAM